MEQRREKIETVVRKCINRLEIQLSEQRIQQLIDRLNKMQDMKTIIDSLALTISKHLEKNGQTEKLNRYIQEIMSLDTDIYGTPEELIEQIEKYKQKNYQPRKYFC